MAIVVLVLWLFTAGAGLYLLVTSNLGRARPAPQPPAAPQAPTTPQGPAGPRAPAAEPAPAAVTTPAAPPATAGPTTTAAYTPTTAHTPTTAATPAVAPAAAASKPELRRAARARFDPPSLTAAKHAPAVPGLRALLEFAHPACALVGLGFWLAYTFIHYLALGWIGFGLMAVTACLGLTWFTASSRAARKPNESPDESGGEPAPSFRPRLVALHGGAAAVTLVLAALTALVLAR